VVLKLCAAALWGAVRNLKGGAIFFRQEEIFKFFYRILLRCAAKKIWSLSGCREPKSLKQWWDRIHIKSSMMNLDFLLSEINGNRLFIDSSTLKQTSQNAPNYYNLVSVFKNIEPRVIQLKNIDFGIKTTTN
jgi:hypothetical protein